MNNSRIPALLFLIILGINNLALADTLPAVNIAVTSPIPQTMFSWKNDPHCNIATFYPDNPLRALVDANNQVHIYANNPTGHYQLLGESLNGPFTASCQPVIKPTALPGMTHQTNVVQNPTDNNYYLLANSATSHGMKTSLCSLSSSSHPGGFVCKNIPSLFHQITGIGGIEVNSVIYYQPAKQFILLATTQNWPPSGGNSAAFVYFTSSDLIHWSRPGSLMAINGFSTWFKSGCTVTGEEYPALLDPHIAGVRRNFDQVMSDTPYLYFTLLNRTAGPCNADNNVNNRDLVRVPVQLN